MTDAKTVSPTPRKRPGFLRVLAWVFAVLLVLLVAAYFVVASSGFFKGVILPRAGKALNAEITVSDASIHPFSSVTLRDLKVTPNGRETLLTAPEIRARYSLLAILRGNLKIEEAVISSPTIHVVQQPDGSSNLDPLLKKEKTPETKPKETGGEKKESEPPQIDLQRLALTDATFRQEKLHPGGRRDLVELTNVTITLNNLKNGDSGKITLGANALVEKNPPAPGATGLLWAAANGEYDFALSADLKPLSIKGGLQLKITRAEGSMADLAALSANLNADAAPTEIKQVALQFQKDGEPLGEVRASGPFNLEKTEGRLRVELLSLDRRVLNLIGATSGIDFGTTAINSTNDIQVAAGAKEISIIGQFNASRLQLTRTNQTTPTLDLRADYNLTVNSAGSNAVIRALTVAGTQNSKPLLKVELTRPMTISLGGVASGVGDSALNLTVTDFNLADWKPFLGNSVSEGLANLKLTLFSQQSGKQLTLDVQSQLANLAPVGGNKRLASASIAAKLAVELANDKKSINGGVQFSNVVVIDPTGSVPATPLEAKFQVDSTVTTNAVDLRQFQITLTPTPRAKNQIIVAGHMDTSNTNAMQGNLKLMAESIDLTTYYDLFAGGTTKATKTSPKGGGNTPQSSTNAPPQEPPATTLPFKNLLVEATIGNLYLREVAISNLQTTLKLDGGHVLLQPFAMTLNNAPVNASADMDLSVPGYRYAIEFNANGIPVAPLANSFAKEYRGKASGDLVAKLSVKGAGTTGTSLQKNLSGDANLSLANANIQVAGKWQNILSVIAGALRVPELANSPVTSLTSDIRMGDGNISLTEFRAAGSAFAANSQGNIAIAPVLNESRIQKLPVNFALGRNLAARAGFKGSGDTNNDYVDLGTIGTVSGTIGNPETKVDYARIALLTGEQLVGGTAGQVLRAIGGNAGGTNANVGNLIQGLGGILGRKPAPANAPATNAPSATATNQPTTTNEPLSDILKLLGPRKK